MLISRQSTGPASDKARGFCWSPVQKLSWIVSRVMGKVDAKIMVKEDLTLTTRGSPTICVRSALT